MNKRKRSKLWIVIMLGLIVYLSCILIDQQKELSSKRTQMNDLNARIEQGEKEKQALQDQKKSINSAAYAEKVAREELGMIKPGEKKFIDVNKN
ncbi:MAG TPA: septum formation initiator family protein [Clostridia bacterium]|nr:septum formation initiator family protein [Clostridia bacterium]